MRVSWRALAAPAAGVVLLAVVLALVGTGPVLRGLLAVDGWSLGVAAAIGAVTTVCAAWRWTVVAAALGMRIPLRAAVAGYYRAQFLNIVLPGGVLGDVHRAATSGTVAGATALGARAVVWERLIGQAVQVALVVAVLVVLPSPLRDALPLVVAGVLAAAVVVRLALGASARSRPSWPARVARTTIADLRAVLGSRPVGGRVVVASAVVVAGHAATFVVAARAVGTPAGPAELLPIAMVMLLAMSVPANVGGWGPREGAAAVLFAGAGLGAEQGLAAATTYGVLALAATLPGAVVLLRDALRVRAVAVSGDAAGPPPRRGATAPVLRRRRVRRAPAWDSPG
jgi:uncharacterized membrane protein YbhN (UPF0104 family)